MSEQLHTNEARFRWIAGEIWSGNLAAYDELFAEDAVIHTPFETFTGRDAYRAYVQESCRTVPDFRAELHVMMSDGDRVAGRFTYRGTQTASTARLPSPATGKSFEVPGANFARFDDGKVVEMWTIWDRMEFFQQLGLFPDSPTHTPMSTTK